MPLQQPELRGFAAAVSALEGNEANHEARNPS
jgi:hypothetical protein